MVSARCSHLRKEWSPQPGRDRKRRFGPEPRDGDDRLGRPCNLDRGLAASNGRRRRLREDPPGEEGGAVSTCSVGWVRQVKGGRDTGKGEELRLMMYWEAVVLCKRAVMQRDRS